MSATAPLHVCTPLIASRSLAAHLGGSDVDVAERPTVWLKLENLQPTATFKIRGLGLLAQELAAAGARRLVCSSGGNAGLAAAYAGARLGLPVIVVVPASTKARMRELLRAEGAEVRVVGSVWDEADAEARLLAREANTGYLPPFDHPTIWRGNASLIEEAHGQLLTLGAPPPDLVICAVGGGGLLCGVLEGLHAVGWPDIPVLAVETEGAASFAAALRAGSPVDIGAITSVATSLGARKVASKAVDWSKQHPLESWVVDDAGALAACRRFADDHRMLVEPACGAALAALYQRIPAVSASRSILLVVCGGAAITLGELHPFTTSQ